MIVAGRHQPDRYRLTANAATANDPTGAEAFEIGGSSGYDATKSSSKRLSVKTAIKHEDDVLSTSNRRRLAATIHDVQRNFAVASWMIRKHLDFVAHHHFNATSPDKTFNREIETYIKRQSKRENFDQRQRLTCRAATRLIESRRVVDGDVMILKLASRHVQGLEADRFFNPPADKMRDNEAARWFNGVLLDGISGRARRYALHTRLRNGRYEFERLLNAENVWHVFYADRFDQVRGISPIAAGLNTLRDVYQGFDYALALSKIAQLFGLSIYREGNEDFRPPNTSDDDDQTSTDDGYDIDLSKPVVLDLEPGDRAEFLENKVPTPEFRDFTQVMLSVALKALDIPYSFFQENFTNFFGSRAALLLYQKSAKEKRAELREAFLDPWAEWQIMMGIAAGELAPPAGLELEDITFEWIPDGVPWWNPSQEITADLKAIEGYLTTRTRVTRERLGVDFVELLDERQREDEELAARGYDLTPQTPDTLPPNQIANDIDLPALADLVSQTLIENLDPKMLKA